MVSLLAGAVALWVLWFLVERAWSAAIGIAAPVDPESAERSVLLGGFATAVCAQAIHFFVPLASWPSLLIAGAVFMALVVWRFTDLRALFSEVRRAVRQHTRLTLVFAGLAVLVAFCAARPCKIEDTVNYHAQVLRWSEAAPLVPGLALVHGRLGFNSLWFPVESLFSLAFLGRGPLPVVNTATFLIGVLFLLRQSMDSVGSRLRSSLALTAMLPFTAAGFLYAGSESPDLPALTYGLLSFFAVADALESRKDTDYFAALCLAVAAACWKLSTAPLVLFAPVLLVDRFAPSSVRFDRRWAMLLGFIAVAGVVTISRSVVLSGYAFFPSTAFDVFPVNWKAPALAHGQQLWVRAFARGFHQDPAGGVAAPLVEWIPRWIANLNNVGRLVMTLLAVGAVLLLLSLFHHVTRCWFREGNRRVLLALGLVAGSSSLFWFVQAPDVRFGASYLIALMAICYLPLTWLLDRVPRLRLLVASAVVLSAFGVVAENLLLSDPVPPWCSAEYAAAYGQRLHWLLPAPYPEAAFVDERLRDGTLHHVVADNGLAFYGMVPNSPLPIAGIAIRRGPELADGYRVDVGP